MARACNYHAWAVRHIRHVLSAQLAATLTCSLLLRRTASTGLLQRCTVWCSSQQYSEAAACPKHCGEDHHTVAKKGTCSTTAGTYVTLASCSSTDRLQAGRTDIQDQSLIQPKRTSPVTSDRVKFHVVFVSPTRLYFMHKPTTRTLLADRSFGCTAPTVWNSLSNE